jgi:hypothetical protein
MTSAPTPNHGAGRPGDGSVAAIVDPALTQRRVALAKGNGFRAQRAELCRRLRRLAPPAAGAAVAEVLRDPPPYARRMTAGTLMRTIHGFGVRRISKIAGRRKGSPLGTISAPERERIALGCEQGAAHLQLRNARRPERRQSLRALRSADKVRLARAHRLGEISRAPSKGHAAFRAAALIRRRRRAAALDGLTVKRVLEAIPGVGPASARRFMRPLMLNASTELGMLSRARSLEVADALIARFAPGGAPAAGSADGQQPPLAKAA